MLPIPDCHEEQQGTGQASRLPLFLAPLIWCLMPGQHPYMTSTKEEDTQIEVTRRDRTIPDQI